MKTFKTEIVKTKLFSGKIYEDKLLSILHSSNADGWQLESTATLLRGFIFKKMQCMLIFSKDAKN